MFTLSFIYFVYLLAHCIILSILYHSYFLCFFLYWTRVKFIADLCSHYIFFNFLFFLLLLDLRYVISYQFAMLFLFLKPWTAIFLLILFILQFEQINCLFILFSTKGFSRACHHWWIWSNSVLRAFNFLIWFLFTIFKFAI